MSVPVHTLATITSTGGLLPAALLARLAAGSSDRDPLDGLNAESYGLAIGEEVSEATNRSWQRLTSAWDRFSEVLAGQAADADLRSTTRERWLQVLFDELGYGRVPARTAAEISGKAYPVSHQWGELPMLLLGANTSLDRRTALTAGAAQVSPHAMVQELLNRSPDLHWALLTNGRLLRLLRDNISLTRQAHVDFDLERMFTERVYSDFTVLWRLLHRSRVEGEADAWWLERWRAAGQESGARALDKLRIQVQKAIDELGTGFLAQPDNRQLREQLRTGDLTPEDYYRQLLRMVYRLLFLFVAEDRDLLHPEGSAVAARERYRYYSLDRIRSLAARHKGDDHIDMWTGLKHIFAGLSREGGLPALAVPGLGGQMWSPHQTPAVEDLRLSNRHLLATVLALAFVDDQGTLVRVDFRNLGAEELGSVYEGLLDLTPELDTDAKQFTLTSGGTDRHATGSHYTPTAAIRQVLDFCLTPAIARCLERPTPADREAALLDLRIVDPACGSGHFLVAAARRIAHVVASVRTDEGEPSPTEIRLALRDVVARCVYGIDINPMAVDLCKVALWMETLDPGRPLGFLDHRIQAGNALLGVPLGSTVTRNMARVLQRRQDLEARAVELQRAVDAEVTEHGSRSPRLAPLTSEQRQVANDLRACIYDSWADAIPDAAYTPKPGDDASVARAARRRNARERAAGGQLRLALDTVDVRLPEDLVALITDLGAGTDDSVTAVTIRAERYAQARRRSEYAHLLVQAQTWTSVFFWTHRDGSAPSPTHVDFTTLQVRANALSTAAASEVSALSSRLMFFHPELAFPEVFTAERGGFDVVVGNPPYLGGTKITSAHGKPFVQFLKANYQTAGQQTNLAAYFVQRGFDLLRPGGHLAYITTDSITETSTRAGSLDLVRQWGGELVNATTTHAWDGAAAVNVVTFHLTRGPWTGPRTLDGKVVPTLTTRLDDGTAPTETPLRLAAARSLCFEGSYPLGDGFLVTESLAQHLRGGQSRPVVRPFLGGDDVSRRPDLTAARWIIDFGGRDEATARTFADAWAIIEQHVRPQRANLGEGYPDHPREVFWQFYRRREELYDKIRSFRRVIVLAKNSTHAVPVVVPADQVLAKTIAVFCYDDYGHFALLSSQLHWWWQHTYGGSMGGGRLTYNIGEVFETFPQPATDDLSAAGQVMGQLETHRRQMMSSLNSGITGLYNRFHDKSEADPAVLRLRELHQALDRAVADAYGWTDVDLTYGFHPTKVGERWVLDAEPRAELLRRLFALNQRLASVEDPA